MIKEGVRGCSLVLFEERELVERRREEAEADRGLEGGVDGTEGGRW